MYNRSTFPDTLGWPVYLGDLVVGYQDLIGDWWWDADFNKYVLSSVNNSRLN